MINEEEINKKIDVFQKKIHLIFLECRPRYLFFSWGKSFFHGVFFNSLKKIALRLYLEYGITKQDISRWKQQLKSDAPVIRKSYNDKESKICLWLSSAR